MAPEPGPYSISVSDAMEGEPRQENDFLPGPSFYYSLREGKLLKKLMDFLYPPVFYPWGLFIFSITPYFKIL